MGQLTYDIASMNSRKNRQSRYVSQMLRFPAPHKPRAFARKAGAGLSITDCTTADEIEMILEIARGAFEMLQRERMHGRETGQREGDTLDGRRRGAGPYLSLLPCQYTTSNCWATPTVPTVKAICDQNKNVLSVHPETPEISGA